MTGTRIERTFLAGPAGPLEALLEWAPTTQPRMAALICHPHPLFGGTMHTKIVFRAAKAALSLGFPALRFNFRGVGQSAGTFDEGMGERDDVRAALDHNGLASPSCHVTYHFVEKHWGETLEAAKIVGHKYIICPWIDEKQRAEAGGWKRAAELFNKAGEESKKAGIQFGYHNHSFEFQPAETLGGKLPYDFLLAETDPKLVAMEMDLCWITVAGKDPAAYFNKYPGRFPLVHVKDYVKDPHSTSSYDGATGSVKFEGHLADVGQGTINWKGIFEQSGNAGIKHYFVENDDPKSAFDDIKISYNYLHDLRF